MTQTANKRHSLYFQLLCLLVVSALVAVSVCFTLDYIIGSVLDRYYDTPNYENKKNQEYIDKLQNYVEEKNLSAKDTAELNSWVKKQKILMISVYQDGVLVFDSEYPEATLEEEEIAMNSYEWENYYPVTFSDGQTEVGISGFYAYYIYNYVYDMELVFSFLLFLAIVLLGLRKKMNYILKLSDEIEVLEGGSLDYEITIQGKDELTILAEGLNAMRLSFRDLIEQEGRIVRENQKIITEMSHDIRTPVTSILLYTELLKQGKYKDEQQLEEYVEKISQKAYRMKQLTEHIFEYSLVSGSNEIALEAPESYEVLLRDLFSETCGYLQSKGFSVDAKVEWRDCSIQVYTPYLTRIMDNITSNLIKYADPTSPILLRSVYQEESVGFSMENAVKQQQENVESTRIGIQSIQSMMEKMNGSCEVKKEDERFSIEILFPIAGYHHY